MKMFKAFYKEVLSIQRLIIILVAINTFVATLCVVNGSSMSPTLHEGDMLVLQIIGYSPQYGDIVVTDTDNSLRESLVKRVIGLSGDVIDFDESGNVLVNGELTEYEFDNDLFGDLSYPFVVPEGHAFLMGDNRNNSIDSRFSVVGTIEYSDIKGKVILRLEQNK